MAKGLTNLCRLRLDGDNANETVLQVVGGMVKFHNRPTTDAYTLEIKARPTSVTGVYHQVESTVDCRPSTATSALGARGISGICRLDSTYTMTGGSLIGSYGQVCNNGTINGSGALVIGQYALIEDGGVYTAVNHLAVSWLDSHLTKTVTAGKKSFQYITNNGTTVFDNVFYIYAGEAITNLFTIENTKDGNLVSDAVTADYTFTKYYKIKVNVGGETAYLIADVV
jgi:hypothetical protein